MENNKQTKITDFDAIMLRVASPENILGWSHGEVLKPETINYRTQKPEKDGLFCERIFGPEKDWECYCGKYKRIRYKGIVCDKCGVEVTRASVRRERMGHIKLASPVSHIWFLRGVPSRVGMMLNLSSQALEKVIYFTAYIINKVDEEARQAALEDIEKEYKQKTKTIGKGELTKTQQTIELNKLKTKKERVVNQLKQLHKYQILSELDYHSLSLKYGHVFEAGTGAETVRNLLEEIDLAKLVKEVKAELKEFPKSATLQRKKMLARARLAEGMLRASIRPEWMIISVLPVLPPDLRPMVPLDGGRYATSDLNDLYRRVINRNNRLKKLKELGAPEIICRNEKRMLQEAVDALIDNSARQPVTSSTGQKRVLKSLADMLKGKQGRFRQNLLGKRVDYSGRSVIVVGPTLKFYQCGLPKRMALELFKPFVIQRLVQQELAHNIRGAGRLIEQETDEVWAALEEVIKDRCVLLNRAPTLHRLGIEAFKPILIEGNAIQLHPLVCRAFNADFDGDQMAVHLPLTKEAQEEANKIMLSSRNLLLPATGKPVRVPEKDMILGCYWMSTILPGSKGEGKYFSTTKEVILAYQMEIIDLRAKVFLRGSAVGLQDNFIETCAGRVIVNQFFPKELGFINESLAKRELDKITADTIQKCGLEKAVEVLDGIKQVGFEYATRSGISWGMDDLRVPDEKKQMIEDAENAVEEIHQYYKEGLLTKQERRLKIIEIWNKSSQKIGELAKNYFDHDNPVYMMVNSKARGNWGVVSQMMGMRGLMVNPAGEVIELPVKGNFKEGLNVLEYFISTHGARKGLADTALRTSHAGYLTRRLVDVAQDVVIKESDCDDKEGIIVYRDEFNDLGITFSQRIFGRVSLEDVKDKDGKSFIVKKGDMIGEDEAAAIEKTDVENLKVRSPLTCKAHFGLCQKCYGYDLGKNKLVEPGEAVGIVTAQAIGEPGTQLTMRTFHTGGVAAAGDITRGLPRVEEIFEARPPKGKALISDVDGKVVEIKRSEEEVTIRIEVYDFDSSSKSKKKDIKEYKVTGGLIILVTKNDPVAKGQPLTEGNLDLKELYKSKGKEETWRYIVKEIQSIYHAEGVGLHDKHIEIVARQMFSRVKISMAGDSSFLPGEVVERGRFEEENEKIRNRGGKEAKSREMLLGISRVALTTESFLSAASFQETARVLIKAAVLGKTDKLRGLKENVIIGKLIPAGTGFGKKRKIREVVEVE